MITVKIRGSKQLIRHLNTLKFVEFEENENNFDDANAEFEMIEKQCINGNELVSRVCAHIDELFDAKERIAL